MLVVFFKAIFFACQKFSRLWKIHLGGCPHACGWSHFRARVDEAAEGPVNQTIIERGKAGLVGNSPFPIGNHLHSKWWNFQPAMLVYQGVFKRWLEAALDSGRILEVFCVCVFYLVGVVIDVHFRHNYAFPPGRERGSLTPKNSKKPASLVGFTPSHHQDYIF